MEKDPQLGTVPLLARSLAVSLPIPVLAPVMTTVFPSNLSPEDQWLQHTPLNKRQVKALIIFFFPQSFKDLIFIWTQKSL